MQFRIPLAIIFVSLITSQIDVLCAEKGNKHAVAEFKSKTKSLRLAANEDSGAFSDAKSLESKSEELIDKRKYAQAVELFQKELKILETGGVDTPLYANCNANLAESYWALSKLSLAQKFAEKAVSLDEQSARIDRASAAHIELLAEIYFAQNSLDKAEEQYKKALQIKEEKLGLRDIYLYADMRQLILTYETEKKNADAERLYDLLFEKWAKDGWDGHKSAAELLDRYAELLKVMGKTAKAEKIREQASLLRKKTHFLNTTDALRQSMIFPSESLTAPIDMTKSLNDFGLPPG